MRTGRAVAVLALGVLTVAAAAWGQVPEKMNYQVMLTNNSDEPLADQAVTLEFRIYSAETGGELKWSETHNVTTNSIGIVSVILGSVGTIHSPDFDEALWLEVEVDDEMLAPRRELVSAPYAFYAADSDALGGLDADDYVTDLELSQTGSINSEENPVDWTQLKNVPAGFADGADDTGGTGDGHSLDADDGDPTDAVYVDADGAMRVGGGPTIGRVDVHYQGSSSPALVAYTDESGGTLFANDETGAVHTSIQPDVNGDGGYFWVANGRGGSAFDVDGNHLGNSNAAVMISGSSSTTSFVTANTGDESVNLPANAVSSPEILDEPGVSGSDAATMFELTGGPEPDILLSATITVPGPGYVLAMAVAEAEADRIGGAVSAYFGLSSVNSFMEQEMFFGESDGTSSGPWNPGVSVHMLFAVGAAGPHTFYFQGDQVGGTWRVVERDLTLVYFPTAYGGVSRTASSTAAASEFAADEPGHPLTEADITAERNESIAANNARIERELTEMEAKITELRASMGNNRP